MFKKAFAFFVVGVLLSVGSKAQQEQTFTQYMFVPTIYNAGHTGSKNAVCATGIMRQQWVGLEGAPTTFGVMVESPVKFLKGGLGLVILSDQIASYNTTTVKLKYAYHWNIGSDRLGIGLGFGVVNSRIDFSYFNITGEDPILISSEEQSGIALDIDAGLYYQKGEKWYAGISSSQINQGKMELTGGETQMKRAFYATGGYHFKMLRIPKLIITPSFFTGYMSSAPIIINAGVLGEYNKMIWAGVFYKYQEGIAVLAGVEYKSIKVSYAYDINTNKLKNIGSHEIRVGYCFKLEFEKPKRSYKNTRYL